MATTVSSWRETSICPRTAESETDSISNVTARMILGAPRTQARGHFGGGEPDFLAGREDLHADGIVRELVGAVRREEGDVALHGVFYLVAKRAFGHVNEDAAAFSAERVGECLRGGDVAYRGRTEIQLELSPFCVKCELMCFEEVAERYVAEGEADGGDRVVAFGGEESDEAVVAPAAEERARVRRIRVKDLEDHARVVVETARDAGVEDDIADAARFERLDTVEERALLARDSGIVA